MPLFSILLGRRVSPLIWLAVAIAVAGLYLICIKEGFSIGKGDLYTLICAALFACHILVIDHYSAKADGILMSCIQFFVAGAIGMLFVLFFERARFSLQALRAAWLPIAYSGIFSAGVGYTLQIIGQRGLNPAIASMLMSMESCFAVLSGWIILGQALTPREGLGCALMFAAIILADLLPFSEGRARSRRSRTSKSG